MPSQDILQLMGVDTHHIDYTQVKSGLHADASAALSQLQESARAAGFELAVASSFRDFERQRLIWNAKAAGERALYDDQGELLDAQTLSDWQLVQAILRWSALPGASRHHWGTDLDVYDAAAVPPDYALQLSPEEVNEGGPFCAFHNWLDEQIAQGRAAGFFRPYDCDRGGVAPERWHLSYAPLALDFQQQVTQEVLAEFIQSQQFALKEVVLAHLEEIYQRYIAIPLDAYPPVGKR